MPTIFEAPASAKALAGKPTNSKKRVTTPVTTDRRDHSVMGPLTAFAVNPDGVRFETQEEEETVVLFLRQHIIVNFFWVVIAIVMIFAPTVVIPFFLRFLRLPVTIPPGYFVIGTLFWYVMTFGFILGNFLRWFFNIYIVTNQRVVDVDFIHLLYKEFSEARLNKIQDLTYKSGGLFAAFFNFGDVQIQTAGELPNFEFTAVPHPERVVETIGELAEKAKNSL